jgi:hypothetical protein
MGCICNVLIYMGCMGCVDWPGPGFEFEIKLPWVIMCWAGLGSHGPLLGYMG